MTLHLQCSQIGANGLNRALEAVESVTSAGGYQFETLVVFVATHFTSSHASSSHYGALNIQPSVSSSDRCLGRAVWSLYWHKRCYAKSVCCDTGWTMTR